MASHGHDGIPPVASNRGLSWALATDAVVAVGDNVLIRGVRRVEGGESRAHVLVNTAHSGPRVDVIRRNDFPDHVGVGQAVGAVPEFDRFVEELEQTFLMRERHAVLRER